MKKFSALCMQVTSLPVEDSSLEAVKMQSTRKDFEVPSKPDNVELLDIALREENLKF